MQEERTRALILARKQDKESALADKAARIGAMRQLASAQAQMRKAAQQVRGRRARRAGRRLMLCSSAAPSNA